MQTLAVVMITLGIDCQSEMSGPKLDIGVWNGGTGNVGFISLDEIGEGRGGAECRQKVTSRA